MVAKDWTGQKYYRLTFIKPTSKRKNISGSIFWEARCDCGNKTYLLPNTAKSGATRSCGCIKEESYSIIGGVRKLHPKISSARKHWRQSYKDCDFNLFLTISQKPCHYCGSLPQRKTNYNRKESSVYQKQNGDFVYNGLDRIDNSKDHTSDNIVPCCWPCNWMKRTLSSDAFLTHIEKIYKHQIKASV